MSSAVYFTPFHPLDYETVCTNRNAHGAGIRILNRPALEDALTDILVNQMDTRSYTDRSEYPRTEWDLLHGFTTWGRDSDEPGGGADHHNMANTYPVSFIEDELSAVSKHTEPFTVWVWKYDPHAAEIADGSDAEIFHAVAFDGDVYARRVQFSVESCEPVEF